MEEENSSKSDEDHNGEENLKELENLENVVNKEEISSSISKSDVDEKNTTLENDGNLQQIQIPEVQEDERKERNESDKNLYLEKIHSLEQQVGNLNILIKQKDNSIGLLEREKNILEKEKNALKISTENAIKEKESIVISFAMKEKNLLDLKRDKENSEKLFLDSKKEIKNITAKYHLLNEEKNRLTGMLEEKYNDIRRHQKENEKLKTDAGNLEMKLKWNLVKLTQETEAKAALEKKITEMNDKNTLVDPKIIEQVRMEQEANVILLKHEIERKDGLLENLRKEHEDVNNKYKALQIKYTEGERKMKELNEELENVKEENQSVQNSFSQELLNSAKLRKELENLQVLQAQNVIMEEKISTLTSSLAEKETQCADFEIQVKHLQEKESELLSINKEISEMIVGLQNEICLQKSKIKAIEAENEILRKEKEAFDSRYEAIESKLNEEIRQKNEERSLLTKHLSEKTKLYETTKVKLDNAIGDLEATRKKHSQIVKELQRELAKCRRQEDDFTAVAEKYSSGDSIDKQSSQGSACGRSQSDSETDLPAGEKQPSQHQQSIQSGGPSKQHLVERILRLQQASARQTEKIDFLENHTMSLVTELQKKSKILQYYMMRDQSGALTSSKSDQNKSELAKYGGIMSAIYTGIKGNNQSMTLELSLEINRKLQAVLEDTLLKNITLKENLDVLGLEVDKLTRQLAKLSAVDKGNS